MNFFNLHNLTSIKKNCVIAIMIFLSYAKVLPIMDKGKNLVIKILRFNVF